MKKLPDKITHCGMCPFLIYGQKVCVPPHGMIQGAACRHTGTYIPAEDMDVPGIIPEDCPLEDADE